MRLPKASVVVVDGAEDRGCSIRAEDGASEGRELGPGGGEVFVGLRARSLERCGAAVSAGDSRVAACAAAGAGAADAGAAGAVPEWKALRRALIRPKL